MCVGLETCIQEYLQTSGGLNLARNLHWKMKKLRFKEAETGSGRSHGINSNAMVPTTLSPFIEDLAR